MLVPSRSEFRSLARQGNLIPVRREILADLDTPVSTFLRVGGAGPAFLMESVEGGETVARYSFLGFRPREVIETRGAEVTRRFLREGRRETFTCEDPLAALRASLSTFTPPPMEGLPPFHGGLVGYLSFDAVRRFERLPETVSDTLGIPDAVFLLTDTVLVFDRAKNVIQVVANARVDSPADADRAYDEAGAQIASAVRDLERPLPRPAFGPPGPEATQAFPEPISNTTREAYLEIVRRAKEYLAAGDIIQVVPSQRFSTRLTVHPFDFYRALRVVNPSPYMYYLDVGDFVVAGASPEMMTRTTNGVVETRPIAGTRPRGRTPEEDEAFAADLLADEKERAEHVMLVDLARNDLGRICGFGDVKVRDFFSVERYSHVMHLVSRVEGRLRPGLDAFDALRATFPAGTLSGAPKIRALEIIDELERDRRGVLRRRGRLLLVRRRLGHRHRDPDARGERRLRLLPGRWRRGRRLAAGGRVPGDAAQGGRGPDGVAHGALVAEVATESAPPGQGEPACSPGRRMTLVIDNYDSFTFNLVQLLGELGAAPEVVRNDALTVDEFAGSQPGPAGHLSRPAHSQPRRGVRGRSAGHPRVDADSRRVPRASGHRRGLRGTHPARRAAGARKELSGPPRRDRSLRRAPESVPGDPVPLAGRGRAPSGRIARYRALRGRWGGHGRKASHAPDLGSTVPSRIHPHSPRA